jgi:hypothetical protein
MQEFHDPITSRPTNKPTIWKRQLLWPFVISLAGYPAILQLGTFHSLTISLSEAEARSRPSGKRATVLTQSKWPGNTSCAQQGIYAIAAYAERRASRTATVVTELGCRLELAAAAQKEGFLYGYAHFLTGHARKFSGHARNFSGHARQCTTMYPYKHKSYAK